MKRVMARSGDANIRRYFRAEAAFADPVRGAVPDLWSLYEPAWLSATMQKNLVAQVLIIYYERYTATSYTINDTVCV